MRPAAPSTIASSRSGAARSGPARARRAVGERQVEEHHDARLRVEAGERDDAHPDRHAEVVAEQPRAARPRRSARTAPRGARCPSRRRSRCWRRAAATTRRSVSGTSSAKPLARALEVPGTGRPTRAARPAGSAHAFARPRASRRPRSRRSAASSPTSTSTKPTRRPASLRTKGGPMRKPSVATCESGTGAARRRHQHAAERVRVLAEVARVAHLDREALAALDRRRDGRPADRGLDHLVQVPRAEAEARRLLAVEAQVEVEAAGAAARRPRCACPAAPASTLLDRRSPCARSSARSSPSTFTPSSLRIPVASISVRVWIGIQKRFGRPGQLDARVELAHQLVARQARRATRSAGAA